METIYVINGFYMNMRSKFTAPGTSIYYYEALSCFSLFFPLILDWSLVGTHGTRPKEGVGGWDCYMIRDIYAVPTDSLNGSIPSRSGALCSGYP